VVGSRTGVVPGVEQIQYLAVAWPVGRNPVEEQSAAQL